MLGLIWADFQDKESGAPPVSNFKALNTREEEASDAFRLGIAQSI